MADTQGEAVLNAVREVVPLLRDNGLESEDRRWIADENIALLEKAEVFRAGVPRRFGGLDLGIADHVRILLEISRGCGSTGWVCQAWITGSWIIRRFPERHSTRSILADRSKSPAGSPHREPWHR